VRQAHLKVSSSGLQAALLPVHASEAIQRKEILS
jgi:hypothetical protein